jgi:lysophospholipase L1-like esterase
MPESPALQQAFPRDRVRQAERFTAALAREHGADVVDARGWLHADDLADGVHPTPAGAERFSERLGRQVALPRLAVGR